MDRRTSEGNGHHRKQDVAALNQTATNAGRNNLLAYAIGMQPGYQTPPHIELIASKLEAVARGDLKRLIIQTAPRHGKSNLVSELFPAWYLGRNPTKQYMATTYGQELSDGFGRKVRNQLMDERFQLMFPECILSPDSKAAARFNTTKGGVYHAMGVGGAATGRGADILGVDDALKNREEADSKLMRDKLWDWFASVAYTRLMPGGAVVTIQCMTGDTPILLADGTEKEIRDVRVGDSVATYRDGALSTSTVENWASNGFDHVFTIRTRSGVVVKANERHPFLVSVNGEPEWIKTRNLRLGHAMFRVNGASGKASPARPKAATSRSSAGATATITTTSNDGPTGCDRLPSTKRPGAGPTSSTGTGSPRPSTSSSWLSRTASALCADSRPARTCGRTGAASCASTTATTQGRFGRFFATIATWLSDTPRRLRSPTLSPNTSDFILDEIVEITASGVEEVFDVQIAETENFIANGLVSHNTRWHEDDLVGRLMNGKDKYELVNLPAVAEENDALNRTPGTALWPERYDEKALEQIRFTIGEREFAALYQQRPAPLEGAMFKRQWLVKGAVPRAGARIAMGVDLALSLKQSADYTAIVIIARDELGKLYVLDAVRERCDFPTALQLIKDMAAKWKPAQIGIETVAFQAVVVQELLRTTTLPIRGITPDRDKVTRAQPLALRYEQGMVSHAIGLQSWFESELLSFPQSEHDDGVDALVYAYQTVMRLGYGDEQTAQPAQLPAFEVFDTELGM